MTESTKNSPDHGSAEVKADLPNYLEAIERLDAVLETELTRVIKAILPAAFGDTLEWALLVKVRNPAGRPYGSIVHTKDLHEADIARNVWELAEATLGLPIKHLKPTVKEPHEPVPQDLRRPPIVRSRT